MNHKVSCDILIVGAGPAGGAAALAAAQRDAQVLVVDRRQKIGVPVQCAEYIPAMLMGHVHLDKSFIVQQTRKMKTYLSGTLVSELRAPGFTIDRALFDQAMIRAAVASGAEMMLSTRVVQRIDGETVLLKQRDGRYLLVQAKVIVGADGPRSTVGQWAGAVNTHLLPGVQVTMALTAPMDWTEVYFYPEIYAGYGWLFPKKEVANIGLGLRTTPRNPARTRAVLERFISRLRDSGKISGQAVGYAAGWIPAEPVRSAVYGNVLLVGDAAGQTHPITGAGIANAVICGEMAGRWAAKAVKMGDTRMLHDYDDEWLALFQRSLSHACQRRQIMEACWQDFTRTIQSCWIAFRQYYV